MDKRTRIRALVQGMDNEQLSMLSEELAAEAGGRRPQIDTDDITVERLKDPQFAAQVRAELDAVLKGIR
jgi:hypothetical protein